MSCPLPNERIGDAIIVASVYFGECQCASGEPDDLWTVLLLHPTSPYFEVAIISEQDRTFADDDTSGPIYNIVDALDVYREWGGDR